MFTLGTRDSGIDPDQIHDVLRNDRRRWTLQYLKQRLEPVNVRELSERVAEMEIGDYNALNQTHLPKLDDVGLVEYDRDRKLVALREDAREVDVYMNVVTPLGISWGTYYRTVGVLGLISVVAADTDIAFLAGMDSLLFATAFLFVFVFSTVYQMWSQRWFYLRLLSPDD